MISRRTRLEILPIISCFLYSSLIFASFNALANCTITPYSIGKIRLGMQLKDIYRAYPTAKLSRTEDGEGAALVAVTVNGKDFAIVFANEDNIDSKINYSNRIDFIETFNSSCSTNAGVRPGSAIADVEKILGKVSDIEESEIESREYVSFKKPTQDFAYRIDYCGDFKNNQRHTKNYLPGCKIISIGISTTQ